MKDDRALLTQKKLIEKVRMFSPLVVVTMVLSLAIEQRMLKSRILGELVVGRSNGQTILLPAQRVVLPATAAARRNQRTAVHSRVARHRCSSPPMKPESASHRVFPLPVSHLRCSCLENRSSYRPSHQEVKQPPPQKHTHASRRALL